jgi:methylmalonyl-CoA epimerase
MKAQLDHIGIAVADLGTVLAFYRDVLDLELEHSEEVATQHVRAHFLAAGGARIELLEATAPDSAIARFLERRGPGLHHVALRVDDLATALAQLRARGVRLIDERPRPGAEGTLVAFIHPSSTQAVLVELTERRVPPAEGPPPSSSEKALPL